MTAVVQTGPEKVKVLTKGADSIILARLASNSKYIRETNEYLEGFANQGLRTLAIAEKEMSMQEYKLWEVGYRNALAALRNRDALVDNASNLLECDLQLLGCTAIEDRLQYDVPASIQTMKDAGIKVWVLTGDKIETAINIGFSCKLLNSEMERYIVDARSSSGCLEQIASARKQQIRSEGFRRSATIVAGDSLLKIMANERIRNQFLKLSTSSSAVLGCRLSPKQKADIVRAVAAY